MTLSANVHRAVFNLRGKTVASATTASLLWRLSSLLLPVLMIVIFGVVTPTFLSMSNFQNMGENAALIFILAIGTTYVILLGSIDLSQGALVGISQVGVALLVRHFGGWSFPFMILFGFIAGLLTGGIYVVLRLPSFLASLAMSGVWFSTGMLLSKGQVLFIPDNESKYLSWVELSIVGIPVTLIFAAIGWMVALLMERRSPFYRFIKSIGAGEQAAQASGVPVGLYKVLAFGLSGATATTAGAIEAARFSAGNPDGGAPYLLLAVVVVVVGGTSLAGGSGGISKTALGALTMTILASGLTFAGMGPVTQQMIIGPVLIAAAVLSAKRFRREVA